MAYLEKVFHFQSSTEGWVATPGDPAVDMAFYPPHKSRGMLKNKQGHQNAPLLQEMGGGLRTSARRGSVQTDNYWEWSGTWEDLGVPPGSVITSVQGNYIWRIDLKDKRPSHHSDLTCTLTKGNIPVGSGPFNLLTSGGVLINSFSELYNSDNRSSGEYLAWPNGGSQNVAYQSANCSVVNGADISPDAQSASNASIKLRLYSRTPNVPDTTNSWLRLKQDYVVMGLSYTPPASGNNKFFYMFN